MNLNGAAAPSENMTFQEKWNRVSTTIQMEKIAILAVQEAHLDQAMTELLQSRFEKNLQIVVSAHPIRPRAKAGVAFVLNKKLLKPDQVKWYELIPGRALLLETKWLDSCNTPILNVYAPNERSEHPEFWAKILTERQYQHAPIPDFTLGNFNVTEDAIDRMPPKLDDANAIEALRDFRHTWDISDTWRHWNPYEKAFTYRARTHEDNIQVHLD